MIKANTQSLKKLSDEALAKRVDELQKAVREMRDDFDRDRHEEYAANDRAMEALEKEDLEAKIAPIEEKTIEGLEDQLVEVMDAVEKEEEILDRMDAEDAADATDAQAETAA